MSDNMRSMWDITVTDRHGKVEKYGYPFHETYCREIACTYGTLSLVSALRHIGEQKCVISLRQIPGAGIRVLRYLVLKHLYTERQVSVVAQLLNTLPEKSFEDTARFVHEHYPSVAIEQCDETIFNFGGNIKAHGFRLTGDEHTVPAFFWAMRLFRDGFVNVDHDLPKQYPDYALYSLANGLGPLDTAYDLRERCASSYDPIRMQYTNHGSYFTYYMGLFANAIIGE